MKTSGDNGQIPLKKVPTYSTRLRFRFTESPFPRNCRQVTYLGTDWLGGESEVGPQVPQREHKIKEQKNSLPYRSRTSRKDWRLSLSRNRN